jgi:hypothetical protein
MATPCAEFADSITYKKGKKPFSLNHCYPFYLIEALTIQGYGQIKI